MTNINESAEISGAISSPGRICLFGEHQDYLGLPVIPMAINRRLYLYYKVESNKSSAKVYSEALSLIENLDHQDIDKLTGSPFDYIKAVFNFFKSSISGNPLPTELNIRSNIPIKSGLSSSAALIVSTTFLLGNIVLKKKLSANQIADIAYKVEHDILGVSCGRMDQTSATLGGIFHMTTDNLLIKTTLNIPENSYFVIGNSEITRQADIPLKQVQRRIFSLLEILGNPNLTIFQESNFMDKKLTNQQIKLLQGILGVRDNAELAFNELKSSNIDLSFIGKLLNEQHGFLRDKYRVSHPRIDQMCDIAKDAGALGAKITGAGFGGCMFALTNSYDNASVISNELSKYGRSFIVQAAVGVRKEPTTQLPF
ncbi:MAG: mevalonate kinase family protein [Promethearchaeota archaeon]